MNPLSSTLREITSALARSGIRYAIGGSVASSARSVWRSTADVDVIAAISPAQIGALIAALGKDWYADPDEMRRALAAGRSFNLIQMKTAQKVDIFPVRDEFQLSQLERASMLPLGEDQIPCLVTTVEDILLAKLRWYVDGGRVSERQWIDITCLISFNQVLDWEYLNRWASHLGVTDLLAKAHEDAAR